MAKSKPVSVKPHRRSKPSSPPKASPKPGPKKVKVDGYKRSNPSK